jgi:hypothetical protein
VDVKHLIRHVPDDGVEPLERRGRIEAFVDQHADASSESEHACGGSEAEALARRAEPANLARRDARRSRDERGRVREAAGVVRSLGERASRLFGARRDVINSALGVRGVCVHGHGRPRVLGLRDEARELGLRLRGVGLDGYGCAGPSRGVGNACDGGVGLGGIGGDRDLQRLRGRAAARRLQRLPELVGEPRGGLLERIIEAPDVAERLVDLELEVS